MKKEVTAVKPLSALETAAYALGSLGREFSNNCVNVFFLVYLCIYQHLDPIIMTLAFVAAKLWDAVNDPLLATLVNNSRRSRFGRYRPWVFVGAVINAATLVLLFTPINSESIGLKYFYYIVMYVLWGMSFTVMDVPFWSMLPTIANSTAERNKASSMAKLIGGLGGFLCGMLGTSFILPKFSSLGMTKAYTVLGFAAGLIMIVFILITVLGNREKYKIPHENVGLKYIFELFKHNDQLRAYAFGLVFFLVGTTLALSQILYLYIYCYEDGANYLSSSYSYTMFWVIACTGQGIAMFFYNQLTKKVPREKIYALSFIMCILSYVLLFAVFFFLKEGNYVLNTVLVALSGAFLMVSSGVNQIGSTVMIADIVDYGEWKTGKRGDSVMFSVQTLITKFAGAIAALILGIGIAVSGLPTITDVNIVNNGVYQQTIQVFTDSEGNYLVASDEDGNKLYDDLANNVETEKIKRIDKDEKIVSKKSLTILRVFMFILPIPLALIGYFIYKKKYWLFGSKYDEIKKEIDQRRNESNKEEASL